MKEIVLSGMRPTGILHLGNYFGAAKNFVKMQKEYNCYFFIADFHALTTHSENKNLPHLLKQVLASYLAAGLNPDECVLYAQSHVPQIPELYLIFNMFAYKGELERVPTFKDKVRSQTEKGGSINAGLLTYPVLMAVDIIIHRAHKVPVGKDQQSHIEICRNLASRFNQLYGVDYFPEPVGFNYGDELLKVPSLDGTGKMSKSATSANSAIFLDDEDKVVKKKIMRAVSDGGPTEMNQEKPEVIQNLFDLLSLVSTPDTVTHFDDLYNKCEIRYGDMKKQLAEDMVQFLAPIRERYKDYMDKEDYLKEILMDGGEKARASAGETLSGVKEIMGMKYF